ncbi:MAG: alpha/beta hydrolase family protein [Devosia sp.]
MDPDLDIVAFATEFVYAEQVVGNSSESMPGYRVDWVFDDLWDNTGFYAVSFANFDAGRVLIAIRGSQDRLDVVTNANLGISQYLANRAPLIDYVGAHILANRITIAGHSLGGGLSQYLGYDAAREFPAFRKHLVVHTQNGLGGLAGIVKMYGKFDREVVEGVTFRNYRHPDDPVSRIGGQAGGNVYNLADPDPLPNGLFFAHSNRRFLKTGESSPFARVLPAEDEAFGIAQTLDELGPQLSRALRQIVNNDDPIKAFARISRLVTLVPIKERRQFFALLNSVLPFGKLWQRSFSRLRRGHKRPSEETRR